jgi:O-antigen/teichoic acid export membrane protein
VRGAAVLFSGHVAAQALSFLRNLLVARMVPAADFGLAATFAVTLSLLEMLGDLSVDKLLVQARDGDDARLQAAAQRIEAVRGLVSAAILLAIAGPVASVFGAPHAVWAFRTLALVPAIHGFRHLDVRRYQRALRFGPGTVVDAVPQLVATLAAWPLALWLGDYRVVLWVVLLQMVTGTALSHVLAERPYSVRGQAALARRFLAFGWPLVVNALLMFAIFQGDRVVVGTAYGLEELGAYSLAFSITFVPTMILANVASPLFLPLLSRVQDDPARFERRAGECAQAVALTVAVVTIPLVLAGGALVVAVFGTKYAAAALVMPWLAAMQAVRILRVAPVLAAVARADTVTSMVANVWRSCALAGMVAAAAAGAPLAWVAAAGLGGEVLAFLVSARRLRVRHGLPWGTTLAPAGVTSVGVGLALVASAALPASRGAGAPTLLAAALAFATSAALLAVVPGLRTTLREIARRVARRRPALTAPPLLDPR